MVEIEWYSGSREFQKSKPPPIPKRKEDSKGFASLNGTKTAACDSEECNGSTTVWRRTMHKGGGWECCSCGKVVKSKKLNSTDLIPDFFMHGSKSKRGQRAQASKVTRKQGERLFKRAEYRLQLKDEVQAGMSTRALGRKYGMSQSSMSRYIRRMKSLNWVHKKPKKRKSRAKRQPFIAKLNPEDVSKVRDLAQSGG